ncbi:MAG: hypothetical protein IJW98_02730 [Clostridia bacterium]|nr:hypothetical protein [Clostridia bacterium]
MRRKIMAIAIVIAIVLLPPLCVILWNLHIELGEIREGNYFDYDLTTLRGGKEAKQFFDEYADLTAYKEMKFYYRDSGRQIQFLRRSWTVFVLDVYYEEEQFREIVNTVLPDTDLSSEYDDNGGTPYEYLKGDDRWNEGFSQWDIRRENPLYQNNCAGFFVDVQHQTVRYCFVYDCDYVIDDALHSSIVLPWNNPYRENDWAFDYPHLSTALASRCGFFFLPQKRLTYCPVCAILTAGIATRIHRANIYIHL